MRPACPHPYLHFSESRQTSGCSLPKASRPLPFSCPEVPGKDRNEHGRRPRQQAVQCDHGVLAQSKGRSPCQKVQDKPCPNSCHAQSLLIGMARAQQEHLCLQPYSVGVGLGPTASPPPPRCPAQPGDGHSPARARCFWEGACVSLLSGARPELPEAPVHWKDDFGSPPLPDAAQDPVKLGQRKGL